MKRGEVSNIWTDRIVRFVPFPRTCEDCWEDFFEALPKHYWERPDFILRLFQVSVGSQGMTIDISGFPWWMPKWWARRVVASIAANNNVGGHAEYVIERCVLIDSNAPDPHSGLS